MASDLADRLKERCWLVDQLRIIAPPQHFMTHWESLDERHAITLLLSHTPCNPVHLYVHVPFCEERCTFCMYFDRGARQGSDAVQRYTDHIGRLLQHFEAELGSRKIHALYVGGGTASILTDQQIGHLFWSVGERLHPDAEATFEMSPRSSTPQKLKTLHDLGFNRISFGLQTFSEQLLLSMHRQPVSVRQMRELLEYTRLLGFRDVNVDLMAGVENEGPNDLHQSAETLFALRPPSVSVYREARPRPGRPDQLNGLENFLQQVVRPRISLVAELAQSHDYHVASDLFSEHVRFLDKGWPWRRIPLKYRYQTRYDPYSEATLIGVGPNAFSFCGGKLFAMNERWDGDAGRHHLSRIYFASTQELGAATAVNLLYHCERGLERHIFRDSVGIPVEELLDGELGFLEERRLIQGSAKAYCRTCHDAFQWAYADKVLYPEQWIRYTRKHGF